MEVFVRSPGVPSRLGILPGTFNPPTIAHVALARTALAATEEAIFVLPRVFPHKPYEGASFEERLRMLEAIARKEPRFSIGSTESGLFIDIARECRSVYGPSTRLYIVSGSDAAQRIVNWDYGEPCAIERMLDEFEMLVADRPARYEPPASMRDRIHALPLDPGYREISATEVRERIRRGERWAHLVPEEIVDMAREIYGRAGSY